jgi:hypothetical protein
MVIDFLNIFFYFFRKFLRNCSYSYAYDDY